MTLVASNIKQGSLEGFDGGEGVDAEVTADDDGIGELVELLHDVADEQGHREGEDDAPGATGGERP